MSELVGHANHAVEKLENGSTDLDEHFFVFFVWTRITFLPNGVRKVRDLQGQNQCHPIRTELQRPVAVKRSEIPT